MLRPTMTPNQTAVTLALGSASRIGATIGTTTTAISRKSRKKPRKKITAMTTMNWVQKPPGRAVKCSLTSSSPPKPRNAEVSIAAPSRMMNTIDVVLAVSSMTPCSVLSILNARHAAQAMAKISTPTAIQASAMPSASLPL